MEISKHITYELILLFSGVLFFRSLWTLMDSISIFNGTSSHIVLLVIGTILTVFAINRLTHTD